LPLAEHSNAAPASSSITCHTLAFDAHGWKLLAVRAQVY
jgi:hypothetical protein